MDWKWNTVALCSICNMINSADRIIMPIVIVSMTNKYEWDLHQQGWILSSFAFGYIASQLIGVKASKKYGNKRVLAFAVLAWSLATIITPVISSHLYLLIFCRILIGLGDGLGMPTIFAIFSQRIPIQRRSSAFVYLIAAGHIGQTMSALVCPHLEWELAFYLFGGLGLGWLLLWLGTFKEDYVNTSTQDDELPLVEFPDKSRQLRWTKFLWSWPLWAIYIAHFSMNWSNYIIMQWLPTYFVRYLEASKEAVSLTAVPYIVNSLCELAVVRSADWLSARNWPLLSVRRLMTFIGLFGPGIFLILFSIVNNLTFAVIFVSIAMGLCAFNSAGHLSNHTDVAPNHASITFAISNTISTIPGILCGPVTAELVTESHGRWLPVFVIAAGVNCVGAVIYASQSTVSPIYQ